MYAKQRGLVVVTSKTKVRKKHWVACDGPHAMKSAIYKY